MYAFNAAKQAGQNLFGGQTPSQFGQQSARDLVDNITAGIEAGAEGGGGPRVIQVMLNDRVLQEIDIRQSVMTRQGRRG